MTPDTQQHDPQTDSTDQHPYGHPYDQPYGIVDVGNKGLRLTFLSTQERDAFAARLRAEVEAAR